MAGCASSRKEFCPITLQRELQARQCSRHTRREPAVEVRPAFDGALLIERIHVRRAAAGAVLLKSIETTFLPPASAMVACPP